MDDNKFWIKPMVLILLTIQNSALILVLRYVRVRPGDRFFSSTAIVLSECLKTLICLIVLFFEEGATFVTFWRSMVNNIFKQPVECLLVSVPAVIYVFQNTLLFLAVSNLDAGTFQITYQLKILTTAIFAVIMLKQKLTRMQWFSLVLLFVGVALVQLQSQENASGSKRSEQTHKQNPFVGLIAVLISCVMSGFAGIWFEKILKGSKQSLWIRNIQLGGPGAFIAIIPMLYNDGTEILDKGFFFGYDYWVFLVILLQSGGGLTVAFVVKYADNILKGFATSAAIILSCFLSMYLFDFQPSLLFSVGAILVVSSVYMYGKFAAKSSSGRSLVSVNAPSEILVKKLVSIFTHRARHSELNQIRSV